MNESDLVKRLEEIQTEFGHTSYVYLWTDKDDIHVTGKLDSNVLMKLAGKNLVSTLVDRFMR